MREEIRSNTPVIYLVGIGMGGLGQLTLQGQRAIIQADAVAGAGRMLNSVEKLLSGKRVLECYDAEEISVWLEENRTWIHSGAVLFSGDTGFYSGAKKVKERLEASGWNVIVIAGISSVSYFASRLGRDWQDAKIISLHGRNEDYIRLVRENRSCFFLLGGQITPQKLCRDLAENGLELCMLTFGSDLSYPEEQIVSGRADRLADQRLQELEKLGRLVCCFAENPSPETLTDFDITGFSLKDQAFIRGNVPMTKEEIRTVALAKLGLYQGACLYDIGAGTGSVAIGAAKILKPLKGKVFAVEKNPAGLELIEKNRKALIPDMAGFFTIPGEAPEALQGLPTPTHAFIGGTGGRLNAIIADLLEQNVQVRIVITAITLETLSECLDVMKQWDFEENEIIQAGISETITAGSYHMQKGRNPVYVITLAGCKGKKEAGY